DVEGARIGPAAEAGADALPAVAAAVVHVVEEVVVDAVVLDDLRARAGQLDHVAHVILRAEVVVVDAAVLAGAGDGDPLARRAVVALDARAREAAVIAAG